MIRAVFDTSILVRAVLRPLGTVGFIPRGIGERRFLALYSDGTLDELAEVLGRERFREKYGVGDEDIQALVGMILRNGEAVNPQQPISMCRDPKDDKFLEVAVEGKADAIVTGDQDLLVLHPFEGIAIIGPAGFHDMLTE